MRAKRARLKTGVARFEPQRLGQWAGEVAVCDNIQQLAIVTCDEPSSSIIMYHDSRLGTPPAPQYERSL